MTKKIDRTVELVLRLESAARQSTGEEARDFRDAAHRLGAYAAACQGFSADLADIAEAVGLSREECLEPPAVVYAVRKMADRMRSGELGLAGCGTCNDALLVLTKWADTAYNGNGERLYTDDEIAAAKDAIVRLDRVLREALAILRVANVERMGGDGPWGDLACAVAAAVAEPVRSSEVTP